MLLACRYEDEPHYDRMLDTLAELERGCPSAAVEQDSETLLASTSMSPGGAARGPGEAVTESDVVGVGQAMSEDAPGPQGAARTEARTEDQRCAEATAEASAGASAPAEAAEGASGRREPCASSCAVSQRQRVAGKDQPASLQSHAIVDVAGVPVTVVAAAATPPPLADQDRLVHRLEREVGGLRLHAPHPPRGPRPRPDMSRLRSRSATSVPQRRFVFKPPPAAAVRCLSGSDGSDGAA